VYKYKLKKLSNGLRVLLVPSRESLSVQVMALVNTGSDFESKDINGISHFIEHMCFKGTKKRPSSMAIAQELDSVGGLYNAFTGQELTGYFVRVAKEKAELALDIISDMYLNSQFPQTAIENERGVIIEEINMYEDDPKSLINNYWFRLLYGDQAAGRPIIGSKTNIRRLGRKDLIHYCKIHYHTRSSLLVISGDFSEKKIMSQVKHYFISLQQGEGKKKSSVLQQQKQPRMFWKNKKTKQSNLILGFRDGTLFDKKKYILVLANAVLNGGMSARLWQRIREELGAAYYIQGSVDLLTDHGFWIIKAGVDNNRVTNVIKVILQEFKRLREELVSKNELKKAKDYIKGTMSLELEDIHNFASFLSFQELLERRIESPQEYWKNIDKIKAEDIQQVARHLLRPCNLNLALISPSPQKKIKELLLSFPN